MTRNILDKDGNIIGELTLPDETSEEAWAEKLGVYSYVAPALTTQQIVDQKIQRAIDFGVSVIKSAATDNVIAGITQAGKTREVSDYLSDLERYLRSGSLYAALGSLEEMIAGEIPEDIQTWVSVERLTNVQSKIKSFLGI